jgi:hypothetical protein
MASAEAVKKGLRRKWQATVKQRSEPSSADAPVLNDEQQWNEQWQKLWRDIGVPFLYSPFFFGFWDCLHAHVARACQ